MVNKVDLLALIDFWMCTFSDLWTNKKKLRINRPLCFQIKLPCWVKPIPGSHFLQLFFLSSNTRWGLSQTLTGKIFNTAFWRHRVYTHHIKQIHTRSATEISRNALYYWKVNRVNFIWEIKSNYTPSNSNLHHKSYKQNLETDYKASVQESTQANVNWTWKRGRCWRL